MNESESKNGKPKKGHRLRQEQYEFLIQCSKEGEEGIKKWNERRRDNPNEEILLEGANLKGAFLENANLINARFCPEYWREGKGEAKFREENKGKFANLENTKLRKARLQNAILNGAHLNESNMIETCLRGATLVYAKLENAIILRTDLESCVLESANIKGAEIDRADLQRANFRTAIVNSDTSIWKPKINQCIKGWDPEPTPNGKTRYTGKRDYTDFQGVALDSISIDPSTKQLLEYNIRRSNWEQWYKYNDWQERCQYKRNIVIQELMWFVRKFWEISDYGISTMRIIWTFGKLAMAFALIYYTWGFIDYYFMGVEDYPGIVSDLFVLEEKQEVVSGWLVPFRAVYFSVVTMTTLGFGDMYANAHSFLRGLFGHTLLALQVILGYVLLGALVTRFAVLFTAGGPAGRFANEQEKKGQGE